MSDEKKHKIHLEQVAENQGVWERTNPRQLAFEAASREYGLTAVRNSYILNGGALVLFPAFLAALQDNEVPIPTADILLAASFFVCGIVSTSVAVLCGYLNFQWHSHQVQYIRDKELMLIDQYYDLDTYHKLKQYRQKTAEWYDEKSKGADDLIQCSFVVGVIAGVASYILFLPGVWFAGRAVLSISG